MKTKNNFFKVMAFILFAVVLLASVPVWESIGEYQASRTEYAVPLPQNTAEQATSPKMGRVIKIVVRYITARF